jgi:uncharacterized RDD family membrane protein YckC
VWDARPAAPTQRYAGFWLRVIAAIVDGIALAILWQIIELFFPRPLPPPPNPDLEALLEYVMSLMPPGKVIAYAVLIWAYFVLQETSSVQATVGKRLLGIRVSTEDGGRLSLAAASIRTWPMYLPTVALLAGAMGTLISSLVGFVGLIACVAVAFSAHKQGLHDKMAGALLTRR